MMDVSDGLVPRRDRGWRTPPASIASTSAVAARRRPAPALEGGEDHALLATFPRDAQLPGGLPARSAAWSSAREHAVLVDGVPYDGRGGWDPYRDWDAHGG